MKIIVRKINPHDYLPITELIKKTNRISLGKVRPKKLIDEYCKKYDLDKFQEKVKEVDYFIAEDEDKHILLGIIGLKNNILRTFFVDPDFQGKGVGRKLFDYLEKEARSRGIKELFLQGTSLGEPVYTHFGFTKIKYIEKEKAGIKYQDAYMKKVLL